MPIMESENKRITNYKLIPPDGGWGHMINVGGILMVGFTLIPISSFALIFGPFLSQYHDEISATSTVTSVFGTVFYTTGLLANFLFLKISCRKVALLGATLYCTGSFLSIFARNLQFLVFSYGILQGLGTGLVLPATLVATNEYFDRRKMQIIAVCQSVVALLGMIYPGFTRVMLDNFGFRGTQAIFTALSLHVIFGAFTLHPVKWHMKKIRKDPKEETSDNGNLYDTTCSSVNQEMESYRLLHDGTTTDLSNSNSENRSQSAISIPTSISCIEPKRQRKRNIIRNLLDLSLLKEITYWNISIGLALCSTSEMSLMALLPIFLSNVGYTKNDVTLLMTVYFTSDLITKIIISLVTLFWRFKSREVCFGNMLLTVILRVVFTEINWYWLTLVFTALLGCSRCIIQFSHPMVLADNYPKQFSSAYSISMVLTGVSSVILGFIIGFVKYKTDNDVMVLHILSAVCLICVVQWTTEYSYKRYVRKK